jgi:hypothetical protein
MNLDHLNFCRQIRAQFEVPNMAVARGIDPGPGVDGKRVLVLMQHYAMLAATAQKFILPESGYLLDDPDLRALDDSEPLRLPFPSIALEYIADESRIESDQTNAPKRVIFAREIWTEDRKVGAITVGSVVYAKAYGVWIPYPEIQMGLLDYVDRTRRSETSGRFLYHVRGGSALEDERIVRDYGAEIDVLLSFLNALQCSNVSVDRSEPRKSKIRHQGQGVLGFDVYHYLTISTAGERDEGGTHSSGMHRSPREHVRRGHVRRLPSGRKTWVNSTVVGAGREGGKIKKDYVVQTT